VRRLHVVLALLVIGIGLAGCNRQVQYNRRHGAVSRQELMAQYPWLEQTFDSWALNVDLTDNPPGCAELAAYPVGNGYCFGFEGSRYPLNALSNLVGPDYQRAGPLWQATPLLRLRGRPVLFTRQRVAWVKQAPIVTTSSSTAEGLRLETFDLAVPNAPCIVRVFVVSNEGKRTQGPIELGMVFNLSATDLDGEALLTAGSRRLRVGVLQGKTSFARELSPAPLPDSIPRDARLSVAAAGGGVVCPLGSLRPGACVAKVAYLLFSRSEQDELKSLSVLQEKGRDPFALLEDCRRAWLKEFGNTVQVVCPDERIPSLLEIQKRIIASQQAIAGGFSPMDKYSHLWVRDSNGPIRFMLAIGAHERVRKALEYHYRGCAQQGKIGNNMPLNLKLSRPPAEYDWSRVPVERAEVPSFVVLQRYWYLQHSGDTDLVDEQLGMLRRCIAGQQVDERGRLPFHGDETYRFPGYNLFNAGYEMPDYVSLETSSADSAFEYCAAARALHRMEQACGRADQLSSPAERVARTLEKHYWQPDKGFYAPAMSDFSFQVHRYPFAPINMRPIWIGYGSPDDERQQQNVINSLAYLWNEDGTARTTPSCGYYVTMTPGYVLYNLAAIGHPAAEKALEGVLLAAEASGGYAEMNQPDNKPSDRVWGEHRIRPWEGGINCQAILYYLTGFEPDAPAMEVSLRPQMPAAWEHMRIENLRVGDCRLSLEIKDGIYTVRRADDGVEGTLKVNLTVPLAGKVKRLLGNWKQYGGRQARQFERYGRHWLRVEGIKLPPEAEVQVGLEYAGMYAPPEPVIPAKARFVYGPCHVPEGVDTIVLTWSKETAAGYEKELGNKVLVLDTKIAWPAEYLRSALFRDDGTRRVRVLITDLSRYPGAFKTVAFWSEGPGKKVLDEFTAAGGIVREHPNPQPLPPIYSGQVAQQLR